MLLLRHDAEFGVRNRYVIASSIIVSFAAMILALPVLHWLGLQSWIGCPFRALTGLPCPTCGYSRAYDLVSRGQLLAAMKFQPFVLVIVLWSGVAAVAAVISVWRKTEVTLPRLLAPAIWVTLAMSWAWNLVYRI